jgi:hypothetical protein
MMRIVNIIVTLLAGLVGLFLSVCGGVTAISMGTRAGGVILLALGCLAVGILILVAAGRALRRALRDDTPPP